MASSDPVGPAATAGAGNDAKAANINVDGLTVVDMAYYDLLGVRADASESQLRSAYKKAALKNHPDRNPNDPSAEERFLEISKAYQVLSDSNLRAVYDRNGKKTAEARPEEGFEDPGQLFAKLFGGERFYDWIGEISLGKDFTKAMDISMSEEEKAAMQAEIAKGNAPPGAEATAPTAQSVTGDSTAAATSSAPAAAGLNGSFQPAASTGDKKTDHLASATAASATSTPSTSAAPGSDLHKHTGQPGSIDPSSGKPSKQSAKLTSEQRKQMDALAEERRKNEIERIQMLTNKLKDRVRPFVQSKNPGDPNDPECKRWEEKMREEIEDLKGESFGLELCRLIGQIYVQKSHAFLKTRKSPMSNFLGIQSWWGKMKDKSATVKEGWQFLSSTIDVQQAMTAMEKQQASGGELAEAEQAKLEEAVMGKIMLVSWRGTRFEVASVLRQVVDSTLAKENGVSEVELVNRAKAVLIIGSVLKNVQVDETDEERREMERLVANAAQKKPKKEKSKK